MENSTTNSGIGLNSEFEFESCIYRITDILSNGAARAVKLDTVRGMPTQHYQHWLSADHFEEETGHKIDMSSLPLLIEPHRYVATPSGPGEITLVDGDEVHVHLFKDENAGENTPSIICNRSQLRKLSEGHPQVNNYGAYISGVEIIEIPFSRSLEIKAEIKIVQDSMDGKWRSGIHYTFLDIGGGGYAPALADSNKFEGREETINVAALEIRDRMADELTRTDMESAQYKDISKALAEMDAWLAK